MKETDILQRFIFEKADIRGEIVHLENTYKTIINQHDYPNIIAQLVGEALVSCILLAGSIKFQGELTLQFRGDSRLPLLIIQCNNQLVVRGYAKYKDNLPEDDYRNAFLEGKMVLTINQYNSINAYQSIVPLTSASMSENLIDYFAKSEQIPTNVFIAINNNRAAGMLLQAVPGKLTNQEEFWEYAQTIGQTLTEDELLNLDNANILHRLYHETEVRLFPSRKVRFGCKCTKEKMKSVLTILGKEDLEQIIQERGEVRINCEFCNKDHIFDSIDIAMLFVK